MKNKDVLEASMQAGWITAEQRQSMQSTLSRLPGVSALSLMAEQELITSEQAQTLEDIFAKRVSKQTTSEPKLEDYLAYAAQTSASDLHLHPENPPLLRVHGELQTLDAPALSADDTQGLLLNFLTGDQARVVREKGWIDFGYELVGVSRFRVSIVRQRKGWAGTFRVIRFGIPAMEELGLPSPVSKLLNHPNGLILVTGRAGQGKSTTLAAMVQALAKDKRAHIITLEDPVEYLFPPGMGQITQREIGTHTASYQTGLKSALREDPDVIVVGEIRDEPAAQLALSAAETGHLVLTSLHTPSASQTIDRFLSFFHPSHHRQVNLVLADILRGVVCQQLVPRADGTGRSLALEILVQTPAVSNLIREGKAFMLPNVIRTGGSQGMCLMEDSLRMLVK